MLYIFCIFFINFRKIVSKIHLSWNGATEWTPLQVSPPPWDPEGLEIVLLKWSNTRSSTFLCESIYHTRELDGIQPVRHGYRALKNNLPDKYIENVLVLYPVAHPINTLTMCVGGEELTFLTPELRPMLTGASSIQHSVLVNPKCNIHCHPLPSMS